MEPRYHSHYSDQATFRTVKELIPDRARGFSPLPTAHTSSEGHSASYSVDAKSKAART